MYSVLFRHKGVKILNFQRKASGFTFNTKQCPFPRTDKHVIKTNFVGRTL